MKSRSRSAPRLSGLRWIALALALSAPAFAGGGRDPRAIEVLKEAAEALRSTPSVRYDFEYGHRKDPTGWVTGRLTLRRVTDASDSWMRARGTVHAQPDFGVAETRFGYAIDGERAWSVDHTAETFDTAPVGAGANRLSWNAVFGILPEFVEAEPLWKELGTPQEVALLEPETVHGVPCDVVRVTFRFPETQSVNHWYLGRRDRLPRRLRWSSTISGSGAMVLELSNLEVGVEARRGDFLLSPPPGYRRADPPAVAGLGEEVPAWELTAANGSRVRLDELRGQVVVMDFWNTWCYICHTVLPRSKELWKDLGNRGVKFFGVNVFEAEDADPAGFWRREGFPYPLLLDGEDVAAALDFPWQPAVAVVGADGKLLYAQLGASHDRADKVRRAIHRGLVEARVAR